MILNDYDGTLPKTNCHNDPRTLMFKRAGSNSNDTSAIAIIYKFCRFEALCIEKREDTVGISYK